MQWSQWFLEGQSSSALKILLKVLPWASFPSRHRRDIIQRWIKHLSTEALKTHPLLFCLMKDKPGATRSIPFLRVFSGFRWGDGCIWSVEWKICAIPSGRTWHLRWVRRARIWTYGLGGRTFEDMSKTSGLFVQLSYRESKVELMFRMGRRCADYISC